MRESWQRGSQKYKHQNSSDVSPLISTEGKEGLSEQHHGWTERKNTETALAYVIAELVTQTMPTRWHNHYSTAWMPYVRQTVVLSQSYRSMWNDGDPTQEQHTPEMASQRRCIIEGTQQRKRGSKRFYTQYPGVWKLSR